MWQFASDGRRLKNTRKEIRGNIERWFEFKNVDNVSIEIQCVIPLNNLGT